MPLTACDHYTSCMDCVLARDPYCGWNLISNSCAAINHIHPNTHSEVVQSLRDRNASHCPAVESTNTIKFFYPGNKLSLLCEPGSNLTQLQWHVSGHPVENSSVVQHIKHNTLLILNASENDAGHYTCTSVETSKGEEYITQTAMYDLRLGDSMKAPLIQALVIIIIVMPLVLVVNLCLFCSPR
ncbi:semaphorin-4E-like isoform X1 [Clarias magur]|uniref:Semaphorin-4E-like isoform X1 n=1 Tax=Clarias magur TaxID=1594786 RepID=A0A8J4U2P4_CLAMG|nr:semaphorin-4E-like isoform X1 [Clarias magur]